MYPDLRARLRGLLDTAPRSDPAPGDRLAAVLLPLVVDPEPSLIFTVRADELPRHAGEVSFPGGMAEARDADLRATALRESQEEVGLDPTLVDVVGALASVHTFVSGILVVPFVGLLADAPTLTVDVGEIAGVFTVSLDALRAAERQIQRPRPGGGIWTGWSYEVEGATIWGATGHMVHDLFLALDGTVR
jgi:8-oxo-dGTP pyrophosphatase MutT (NUDIX family)